MNNKDMLDDEVFEQALIQWGEKAQVGMMIEEMGEALTAINHYARGRITYEELIEEFVDVHIMTRQMKFMNQELFDKIYKYKVKRIRGKLGI